ncbi:MAG: Gfo/Idh/MocA family oxidoreductase [Anaerolineae bacterium]|nr:Gfo/Idh/MocA family oxidoreductase [Anaerolineae bacterium]
MSTILNWGLLSTARINSSLINPIRESESSHLVAVASRSPEKAAQYAREWNIPKSHGSYEALLADPDIDVIYNSLPNSMHAEWTVKAAQHGKHVLCEKPLVPTLAEWEQINNAAMENNVTIFEAFMYLHHPQTLTVLDMVRQGKIGTVQVINSWFSFYLSPEQATNIRLNPDLAGGALLDVGVYPNSMANLMADAGAPVLISANQMVGETGVDVNMIGQLTFSNNTVAQVVCGFRMPFRQGTTIVGSEGSISIPEPWKPGMNGKDSVIQMELRNGTKDTLVIPAVDPYLCEVQAMEACVLRGADPVVPLSFSRQLLQSSLAQYESARTGQTIYPKP